MTTIRMFAFAASILITAALFGAIADGFATETAIDAAPSAHAPAAATAAPSAADRASP